MSKLPDPVAWSVTWQSTHCGNFFFRSEDAAEHKNRLGAKFPDEQREIVALYSEAQVKELLAERDAVLRQALNALYWTTPIGGKPVKQTQDAMDAIRKVLG